MKNNKGITLISLVASILLLLILSATTVSTSMNAYKQMEFEGAKAEIEEVEKLVDEIASDFQTYQKEIGGPSNYIEYFKARYNTTFKKLAENTEVGGQIDKLKSKHSEVQEDGDYAFYFSEDNLMKTFGLKGISPVVVKFDTRTVYSVEGIKDPKNNEIYYTPADWGGAKEKKNASTTASITGVTASRISNHDIEIKTIPTKAKCNISEVYISKGTSGIYTKVAFRDCSTADVTIIRIAVDEAGSYKVRLVDDTNNVYESNSVNVP